MEQATQKVLYVEDNPLNMVLMRHIFKRNLPSLLLVEAGTGAEALELAAEHRPDLIILDIGLPDISGYEVLDKLRKSEEMRDIKVLAISAFALADDIAKAQGVGFAGYVTKPFQVKPFTELVIRLLA